MPYESSFKKIKIITINHMFRMVIWDKLPNFYFKIFKIHESDLSPKSFETNMWLLVNHTKPTKFCVETNIF